MNTDESSSHESLTSCNESSVKSFLFCQSEVRGPDCYSTTFSSGSSGLLREGTLSMD